jgi:hypothetical protein
MAALAKFSFSLARVQHAAAYKYSNFVFVKIFVPVSFVLENTHVALSTTGYVVAP